MIGFKKVMNLHDKICVVPDRPWSTMKHDVMKDSHPISGLDKNLLVTVLTPHNKAILASLIKAQMG